MFKPTHRCSFGCSYRVAVVFHCCSSVVWTLVCQHWFAIVNCSPTWNRPCHFSGFVLRPGESYHCRRHLECRHRLNLCSLLAMIAVIDCFAASDTDCRDRRWLRQLQQQFVEPIAESASPMAIYRTFVARSDNWCRHFPATISLGQCARERRHALVNLLFVHHKFCNRRLVGLAMLRTMSDANCHRRCSSDCFYFSYLWHGHFETRPSQNRK